MSEFVTLPQTRLLTGDDVDRNVIDEFVKNNFILENIPFHRAAAPTGGDAFAYTYTRLVTQPDAEFRALGSDYTASTAEVEQHTVVCKVLGGKFGIDRAIAQVGGGAQVALNISQKVKGAQARFCDAVINGDEGDDANSFDGLSVALAGSDTEIDGSGYNWSDVTGWTPEAGQVAYSVLDALDSALSEVSASGVVTILGNKHSIARIKSAARVAGYRTASEDAAGRVIDTYAGVPLIDLGAKPGSNSPVISTVDGVTDLYIVNWAMDGVHAVSPAGAPIVSTRLPNPDSDSVTLTGWVEMLATLAVKQTKAAAVIRGLRVAPAPLVPGPEA